MSKSRSKARARMPVQYPQVFLNEMAALLGNEYEDFHSSLLLPAINGLRVNSLKIDPEDFKKRSPYLLSPVSWCPSGFSIEEDSQDFEITPPGKHPYHSVGLYYLQEPSAMVAAEVLAPQSGEKILDLAAAPGGKSTHLAALMKNTGILVVNEIHPKRVWDLAENIERMGITNTVVLNETPQKLAAHFFEYFDRVLVDAPCSGEGMLRKSDRARQEWTANLPQACAMRQAGILENAASMVKPGGHFLYTTCTFSPIENEGVIAKFLENHPEFDTEAITSSPGFDTARPDWINLPATHKVNQAIRIWPHHTHGEGHFAALLVKNYSAESDHSHAQRNTKYSSRMAGGRQIPPLSYAAIKDFVKENLDFPIDEDQIFLSGSYFYQEPPVAIPLDGLKVIHPGWWIGTLQRDRFIPSHALAMGVRAYQVKSSLQLGLGDTRIAAYLSGGNIPDQGDKDWVLMTVDGFPLGWGRRVNNAIKNYYPHGLRRIV